MYSLLEKCKIQEKSSTILYNYFVSKLALENGRKNKQNEAQIFQGTLNSKNEKQTFSTAKLEEKQRYSTQKSKSFKLVQQNHQLLTLQVLHVADLRRDFPREMIHIQIQLSNLSQV